MQVPTRDNDYVFLNSVFRAKGPRFSILVILEETAVLQLAHRLVSVISLW